MVVLQINLVQYVQEIATMTMTANHHCNASNDLPGIEAKYRAAKLVAWEIYQVEIIAMTQSRHREVNQLCLRQRGYLDPMTVNIS